MSTNVRNLSSVDWESGPDRKLAHNTYRETNWLGQIGVRYHGTRIIELTGQRDPETFEYPDRRTYRLTSGGWRTSTTKQRLNALMPGGWHIHQSNHNWYLTTRAGVIPFRDGMILNEDGEVVG